MRAVRTRTGGRLRLHVNRRCAADAIDRGGRPLQSSRSPCCRSSSATASASPCRTSLLRREGFVVIRLRARSRRRHGAISLAASEREAIALEVGSILAVGGGGIHCITQQCRPSDENRLTRSEREPPWRLRFGGDGGSCAAAPSRRPVQLVACLGRRGPPDPMDLYRCRSATGSAARCSAPHAMLAWEGVIYRANRVVNFAQADLGSCPSPSPVVHVFGCRTRRPSSRSCSRDHRRRDRDGVVPPLRRSARLVLTVATLGIAQLMAVFAILIRAGGPELASNRIAPRSLEATIGTFILKETT